MNISSFLFPSFSSPVYSSIKEETSFKKLAQGKAKVVWKKIGEQGAVYYTCVKVPIIDFFRKLFGTIGLKEKELRAEVMTSKRIKNNLYEKKIHAFVDSLDVFSQDKTERIKQKKTFAPFIKSKLKDLVQSSNTCSLSLGDIIADYNASDERGETEPAYSPLDVHEEDFTKLQEDLSAIEEYLTLDFTEGKFREGNAYAVKTQKAKGDLEEKIREKNLDLSARFKMGEDVLTGLSLMQESGHVHGDLKPENVLVYKNDQLKIADYGKTKAVNQSQETRYNGNNYFAPPEWKLSQKGEVFSAGAVIIRILEEAVMDGGQPLLIPKNKGKEPHEKYRGFSRFLIMGNQTSHLDTSNLKGKITAVALSLGLIQPKKTDLESEVAGYVGELIKKLIEKSPENEQKLIALKPLLLQMMEYDPNKRPSMTDSSKRYKEIFNPQIGVV